MERRIRWRRGREQEGRNERLNDWLLLQMNTQNRLLLRAAHLGSLLQTLGHHHVPNSGMLWAPVSLPSRETLTGLLSIFHGGRLREELWFAFSLCGTCSCPSDSHNTHSSYTSIFCRRRRVHAITSHTNRQGRGYMKDVSQVSWFPTQQTIIPVCGWDGIWGVHPQYPHKATENPKNP